MISQNQMAEPKKDDKKGGGKPAPKGASAMDDLEAGILVLLLLGLISGVVYGVSKYFGISSDAGTVSNGWQSFKAWFSHFAISAINSLTFISIFCSLIFLMAAYYSKFRKSEIVDDLKHKDSQVTQAGTGKRTVGQIGGFSNPARNVAKSSSLNGGGLDLPGSSSSGNIGLATVESAGSRQWSNIEKYMNSHNPSDWRLAILEADILLYDMLEQIGFQGDTIGDKLKSIEPASFNTLDDAWRAHKVRNMIAHEGSNYELNYAEARKAINSYKKVFDEFYFI